MRCHHAVYGSEGVNTRMAVAAVTWVDSSVELRALVRGMTVRVRALTSLPIVHHPLTARIASAALSAAVVFAVLRQLGPGPAVRLGAELPTSAGFWLAFAAAYFVVPAADWLLFRRLFAAPVPAATMLKRMVLNLGVLGYSGDAWLLAWARRRGVDTGRAATGIKDAAVLSAATGNVATLIIAALVWPSLATAGGAFGGGALGASMALVGFGAAVTMVFWRRILHTDGAGALFISSVHMGRILLGMGFAAATWKFALPDLSIGTLLLLSALRMIAGRLPFIPNKDIAFAGAALLLFGNTAGIAEVIALTAMLTLLAHLACWLGLAVVEGLAVKSGGNAKPVHAFLYRSGSYLT